jgi:hypothetical protein
MSKKFELQIPKPCHENWDNMSPVEKGRFCGSCQKQVMDFSSMSDREIATFFRKPSTGSVCGRFMSDQLNRAMELPKKRIPWVRYFLQFLLPGILISAKAAAQNKARAIDKDTSKVFCSSRMLGEISFVPRMGDTILTKTLVSNPIVRNESLSTPDSPFIAPIKIQGQIIDDANTPISFANIQYNDGKSVAVTDGKGNFEMVSGKKNMDITITAVGYDTKTARISWGRTKNVISLSKTDRPFVMTNKKNQ